MRTFYFAIFLSIILLIYSSVNYYVLRRALQAIPEQSPVRIWFIISFIILAGSYFLARFLEKPINSDITYYFIWFGSFWLAAILYFFLIVLFLDILRLTNHWFNYFPEFITSNWQKVKIITLLSSLSLVLIIVSVGFLNNFFPKIVRLDLTIPKKESHLEKLKIILASDIHLGISITNKQLTNLVDIINTEKPDIVLFAGDILDEDPKYLIKNNLGHQLDKITSKYGTWGILGNHEYIGGVTAAEKYIKTLGINILKDESVIIDDGFNLVGRDDFSSKGWGKKIRKNIPELLSKAEQNLPIIMMDHQPFKLNEASHYPIDLQVSGHTHHGQLWPFNFITKAIYEKSFGYIKLKNTHFYVSAGYGIWGPPVRTVSRPEIIVFNIKFQ